MMCKAEVTGSLVPVVAKQIQSVEPVGKTAADLKWYLFLGGDFVSNSNKSHSGQFPHI